MPESEVIRRLRQALPEALLFHREEVLTRARYERSRYTLWESRGRSGGMLFNTLSGALDIVPADTVRFVADSRELSLPRAIQGVPKMLVDRGYYVESRAVESEVARWLAVRVKERDLAAEPTKYVLGLTLQCNLACGYCWQEQEHGRKRNEGGQLSVPMADAIFGYIDRDLERRGKQPASATISLFGGEPLLDTPPTHRLVNRIGESARNRGMRLHFTTNGKSLTAFRREVAEFKPSIQVTADGARMRSGRVHLLRAGQPLTGVYEALAEWAGGGLGHMMLRFLATPSTAKDFIRLADAVFRDSRFDRNFTLGIAPLREKSQPVCSSAAPKASVLASVMPLLARRRYANRVAFLDWRSLSWLLELRSGKKLLPFPGFYHCESNLDLVGFDHQGYVYTCFEAIGRPELAVGTYWPGVTVNEPLLRRFRDHSAFSMPGCGDCSLAPICGGGCQIRAYKKNAGYDRPYCDALHAEVKYVMKNWSQLSRMLSAPASTRQPGERPR